jgi:hypothetical protein
MTTIKPYDTLALFGQSVTLAQYNIVNAFRIMRPVCKKYKLTVNSVIILLGSVIYNKYIGSGMNKYNFRRFIGYYNSNKIDYYINLLCERGYLVKSDIIHGKDIYKITDSGMNVYNDIEECYNSSLYSFISKYNL